jgi:hypothetical protein
MALTVDNFRSEASEFLHSKLASDQNALIDAPPGLGKSRAAAKVALKLIESNQHRVVIIEPTKTLRSQIVDYIKDEKKEAKVHESKGWNDYRCPIIETDADSSLCSIRKDQCREENLGCGVLKDIDSTKTSNLTVATFPKLLLSRGMFADYDTVIVDESHGFENAETTYLQTYLMIERIDTIAAELSGEYPVLGEKLRNTASGLSRMRDMLGDASVLSSREIDSIREALGDESLKNSFLEFTRNGKFPHYRTLYTSISTIHFRMQNISSNVFFFYEGALYGRPKNMSTEVSGFFRTKNVGLLSATVDDPLSHARACGIDLRRFDSSCAILLRDYPVVRRKNRLLLALTDGPNLSRSSPNTYLSSREQANKILYGLLSRFRVRTLVLFRGYNDHKDASAFLARTELKERIINIEQGEDPDTIDDKISRLRSNNVVLSSASTRLWEGVDIPELRLVIIDALPYPGKDPLDSEYNFRVGYRTMTKKLKQGLGRIVRSDKDWGAAVVIDRRFCEQFDKLSAKLPWHMDEDFQRKSLDKATLELESFVSIRENT